MSGHTPGPWECGVGHYDGGVYCDNELGSRVAIVYGKGQDYPVFSREEEKANARLIAASPELLDCLKEARKHLENADIDLAYIDEVIAKAEGRV